MKKSNHERFINNSWERLQNTIELAEKAYNNTTKVLQELGEKGITKIWIGEPPKDGREVTPHSLYTHQDYGGGGSETNQHDILSRIGVGSGCSNGNGKQYQTQIKPDSLVYGTYTLNENGWIREE